MFLAIFKRPRRVSVQPLPTWTVPDRHNQLMSAHTDFDRQGTGPDRLGLRHTTTFIQQFN